MLLYLEFGQAKTSSFFWPVFSVSVAEHFKVFLPSFFFLNLSVLDVLMLKMIDGLMISNWIFKRCLVENQ